MSEKDANLVPADCCLLAQLPDHLLIEIFIRVPMSNWGQISCVRKHWANLFREECFWFAALLRSFPFAGQSKRWPGPIPRGLSKRSITTATQLSLSLYIYLSTYSKHIDLFTAKKKIKSGLLIVELTLTQVRCEFLISESWIWLVMTWMNLPFLFLLFVFESLLPATGQS